MAWSDEPTTGQLSTVYNLIQWKVSPETAKKALKWLEDTATRQDVSFELTRLRNLQINHKLTKSECFKGEIWEGFNNE